MRVTRFCGFLCRYIPEGFQCSCGPDWYTTGNKYNTESFVIYLFCFCFAVPFTTICFCYSQLLFMLKSVSNLDHTVATDHHLRATALLTRSRSSSTGCQGPG